MLESDLLRNFQTQYGDLRLFVKIIDNFCIITIFRKGGFLVFFGRYMSATGGSIE